MRESSIQLCQSDVTAGLNVDRKNQRLAILHGKKCLSFGSSSGTRLFNSLRLTGEKDKKDST